MIIDIAFILAMIFAIFKGLRKGLILGIFSLLAFIIGLAAALKLSVVVAGWLKDSTGSFSKWLPLISFILVFVAVALVVNLAARAIKKTMQFAMLGWMDSLGGMALYIVIYAIIFSVFLFYANNLFPFYFAFCHISQTVCTKRYCLLSYKCIHHIKANIMARVRIFCARVAQSHNKVFIHGSENKKSPANGAGLL